MQFIYGTNRAMHFYIKKKQKKTNKQRLGNQCQKAPNSNVELFFSFLLVTYRIVIAL